MRLQANLLLAALQAWPHARNQPDFPLTMIIAFVAATAVAIALAPLFLWQMVCVTYAQVCQCAAAMHRLAATCTTVRVHCGLC